MEKHQSNSFVWNIPDEEFLKIINENKGFLEIGKKLGFKHKPGSKSRNAIRERALELGIKLEPQNPIPKNFKLPPQNIKRTPDKLCLRCSKKVNRDNKTGFCAECLKIKTDLEKIQTWKETGDTGCQAHVTLRNIIRDYIFEKQNKKCAICNMDSSWNGKELHFILDHIDGDASNNWENNLRLICPNCDSQLPTFKSRNKNSARNSKRQKK